MDGATHQATREAVTRELDDAERTYRAAESRVRDARVKAALERGEPRVFFGTPVGSSVHPATAQALDRVKAHLNELGMLWWQRFEPRGSLPLAHSLLAEAFLATDATKLLIVHADVAGFTPEDVLRVVRSPEDVVGAPIPGRSFEPERIRRAIAAGIPLERVWQHASPMLLWPQPNAEARADLVEVMALSTGFLCLSRRAVEDVATRSQRIIWEDHELAYSFEEVIDRTDRLGSEDFAFCMRWRAGGGKVWADTRTELTHYGMASFHAPPLADLLEERHGPRRLQGSVRIDLECPEACDGVAREVLEGAYDLPVEGKRLRVLDLGANVGAFARWALARWPDCTVHAYEPDAEMVAVLRRNLATAGDRFVAWEGAITVDEPTGEAVAFAVSANPVASHLGPAKEGERVVKAFAFNVRELPPAHVLKVDIEGNEPNVLRAYLEAEAARPSPAQQPSLSRTVALRGIAAEWHSVEARAELRAVLERFGFRVLDERAMRPDREDIGVMRAVRP
jgi:FkbM family methyltransferase